MLAHVLVVVGTRPEVIKMAPVVAALRARPQHFDVSICAVAQQGEVLDRALEEWHLVPQHFIPTPPRTGLASSLAGLVEPLERVLMSVRPDVVLVQGDTTTAFAAALCAFYGGHRLAHVEAGLRTHNLDAPFPEEMHRASIARMASIHYAPTERARTNLLDDGCDESSIVVVGNTVVDALLSVQRGITTERSERRSIVVTAHRRENFNGGISRGVCGAIKMLVRERDDVDIHYVLHPHPRAREPVERELSSVARVRLLEPMGYLSFLSLIASSDVIVTDSGGLQEEAPYLGKPLLVIRDQTERGEAVDLGSARIVGTSAESIASSIRLLLDDPHEYAAMAVPRRPFGDGGAAERIADDLSARLGLQRCA